MIFDSVIAIVDNETLTDILPIVHAQGLGNVARVLSAERGDLQSQLKRMGVPSEGAPQVVQEAALLLVLSAAARSRSAGGLLLRAGASPVWTVTRHGEWQVFDDAVTLVSPGPSAPVPAHRPIPGLHDSQRTDPEPAAPEQASS